MKLFLIRHAKTKVIKDQASHLWQLEPSAYAASQNLARELKGKSIDKIISSKEPKAAETARAIAQTLELPFEMFKGLEEHDRTGVSFIESQDKWLKTLRAFFANPDSLIFGNETAEQARLRFDESIKALIQTYPNGTLAIVSHGTVMALFISHYNNLNVFEFWQTLKMPDYLELSLPDFRLLNRLD